MRHRVCALLLCAALLLPAVFTACNAPALPDVPETEYPGIGTETVRETETVPSGQDPEPVTQDRDEFGLLVSRAEYGGNAGRVSLLAQDATVFSGPYDTLRIRITDGAKALEQVRTLLDKVSCRSLQFELPVNTDIASYSTVYPSYLLKDSFGNVLKSGKQNLLMPFKTYSDYISRTAQSLIEVFSPEAIVLDAPQIPVKAFYGQSFKDHWQAVVKTAWKDPAKHPEAARTMVGIADSLSGSETARIAETIRDFAPNVRIILSADPSGSDSYYAGALDRFPFDGTVVRIASDPALEPVRYAGKNVRDAFRYISLSAASLSRLSGATMEITLDRVGSDASFSADYLFDRYLEMVCALMLNPNCSGLSLDGQAYNSRRVMTGDFQYRSSSMDLTLADMQNETLELHSGSAGIGILMPDPHLAALDASSASEHWEAHLASIGYSLFEDQIQPVLLDELSLSGPNGLESCSVLYVASSMLRTLGEDAARNLKNWVEGGGVLIYLGGDGTDSSGLIKTVFDYDVTFERLNWSREISPRCADPAFSGLAESLLLPVSASGSCSSVSAPDFTDVLTLSDQPMTVFRECGKGGVFVCGLSCEILLNTETASCFIRGLAELAFRQSGKDYVRGDLTYAKRGNYLIVRTGETPVSMKGYLMDISDPGAMVKNGFTIPAHTVCILRGMGEATSAEASLLVHSPDAHLENREGSSVLSFPAKGQTASAFVHAPQGLYPASVRILDDPGVVLVDTKLSEDKQGFFISLSMFTNPVSLEILWSDQAPKSVPVISGYVLKTISVPTNKTMQDQQWIDTITAPSNDALHFCDLDTFLIYRFDLNQYLHATFSFSLVQNYIIEMSEDKENWVLLKDYSEGGTVPHTQRGDNPFVMVVTPDMYGDYSTLYIRLRNSDITKGWGGSISSLEIQYYEKG